MFYCYMVPTWTLTYINHIWEGRFYESDCDANEQYFIMGYKLVQLQIDNGFCLILHGAGGFVALIILKTALCGLIGCEPKQTDKQTADWTWIKSCTIYEECCTRSRYQGQGQVITSHRLWDVITYHCPWYLLLAQHSPYHHGTRF